MNVALRGRTVLVGGTAVVMALSTQALAIPASATTTSVQTVHTCSQQLTAGDYTCFAIRRSDLGFKTKTQVQATPLATPSGYGPSSLQSAYKLPSSSAGSGQRVYIVDAYNDPNAESDLAAYRTQFGLPACTTANVISTRSVYAASRTLPAVSSRVLDFMTRSFTVRCEMMGRAALQCCPAA